MTPVCCRAGARWCRLAGGRAPVLPVMAERQGRGGQAPDRRGWTDTVSPRRPSVAPIRRGKPFRNFLKDNDFSRFRKKFPVFPTGEFPVFPSGEFPVFPSGEFPVFPSGEFPVFPSGEFPVFPSGEFPVFPSGEFPVFPTGEFPVFPTGEFPVFPTGEFPVFPSGEFPVFPTGEFPVFPTGEFPVFPTGEFPVFPTGELKSLSPRKISRRPPHYATLDSLQEGSWAPCRAWVQRALTARQPSPPLARLPASHLAMGPHLHPRG
ncbi:unnamed protein product [Arctogadus glacialis]